jgi:hypothetical protein
MNKKCKFSQFVTNLTGQLKNCLNFQKRIFSACTVNISLTLRKKEMISKLHTKQALMYKITKK